MSNVTVNEIEDQEANIFNDHCNIADLPGGLQAKAKALQQLAVSEDSPFNLTGGRNSGQQGQTVSINEQQQLQQLRDEKARLLREETEEIKRQLELVKSRLNELSQKNLVGNEAIELDHSAVTANVDSKCCEFKEAATSSESIPDHPPTTSTTTTRINTNRREFVTTNHLTSVDSQFYKQIPTPGQDKQQEEKYQSAKIDGQQRDDLDTKFRPLTGKTDCPNCICDRRQSVCPKCVVLQSRVVQANPTIGAKVQDKQIQNEVRDEEPLDLKSQPTLMGNQQLISRNSAASEPKPLSRTYKDYDERPIRPAKQHFDELRHQAPMTDTEPGTMIANGTVDRYVVPNKVFTIGKSLDEKRTKLAQAIEDLQIMMDKVKKRGERLDQERKVAQFYKDQWKFGPAIGGVSRAGSRDSLKSISSQYNSRFDPNLARDTNSMMGFQHIEPMLKLRQYNGDKLRAATMNRNPPKPSPRFSKLTDGKLVNNNSDSVSNNYLRPTTASALHSKRSKSLETLPIKRSPNNRKPSTPKEATRVNPVENFEISKSSSEINLSLNSIVKNGKSSPDQPIEEELEEEIKEDEEEEDHNSVISNPDSGQSRPRSRFSFDRGPVFMQDTNSRPNWPDESQQQTRHMSEENQVNSLDSQTFTRPKRVWVPVFGETEIKTINHRPPDRKVVVLNGNLSTQSTSRKSILRKTSTNVTTKPPNTLGRVQQQRNSTDRVLKEATKKLQFASNLLERERHDSHTKNQLVVNKHRPLAVPKPRQQAARPISRSSSGLINAEFVNQTQNEEKSQESKMAQSLIINANKEICRLEEMIGEQQKLLVKLTAASNDENSCCHAHKAPCQNVACSSAKPNLTHPNRQLIANLRDRLNKTKARLAKTLEGERAKHQQLEQKFDSSLRKQSDLEHENAMLKKSLSKCIDTCLRDISSTFESLSDTLSESITDNFGGKDVESSDADVPDNLLPNAAQLITDNRHIKRMKSHIDTIERQRCDIFEELNKEKHKSQQLEFELKQSKLELDQLVKAKRQLEVQLSNASDNLTSSNTNGYQVVSTDCEIPEQTKLNEISPSNEENLTSERSNDVSNIRSSQVIKHPTQKQVDFESNHSSLGRIVQSDSSLVATDEGASSLTPSSVDLYRQYIQSMTPDLDAIRRERRMILSEFDNIKKMLSDMDN